VKAALPASVRTRVSLEAMHMQLFIFVVIFGAAVTLALVVATRWASLLFTRDLTSYLSAGESVVNYQRIPDAWLRSYRTRVSTMRAAGEDEHTVEAVGLAAQKHCLAEFDRLINFFERNNLTDGDETRDEVIATLHAQRERWERASWQELFVPDPPRPSSDAQEGSQ
jgi:hypothetical protein